MLLDYLFYSPVKLSVTETDSFHLDVYVLHRCATPDPHVPHVLVENGDMTQEEYDEFLHSRSDFIKATKKDSSNQRKVSVSPTLAFST